ncbi:MAG: acetylpolyamine amidohydrolase [Stappia sp.]|uniref:histone deacetylase family protein n=1 Tax=Stappia sp. TaxID=1870903 RepID=UPI000C361720|nr:histone deacetylase family protein [Stappia sp.]MAB00260.1 acetylpolyamine amidohydrolase [Stappia sp.]MBM21015.1 acetylpolyamine amidohydrolase [Stappia sp.]
MKTVFSPVQLAHDPKQEISDGMLKPAVEIPSRATMVRDRVIAEGLGSILEPEEFGRAALERVHDAGYLDFLESFWGRWTDAGRSGEAFPFVWPVRGLSTEPVPEHIDGLLGRYSFDAGTPLGENTFAAARASANSALTAARLVAGGERSAFALSRPPGHHAAADYYGGYCFLNNAAIAAQWMRDNGAARVAVLDVDYHHGNGTQSIFYDRSDVLFLSIHADPREEYPYFLGHAQETGEGDGEGFNVNLPLAPGADWAIWSAALEESLGRISAFGADTLIVSLGLDTYEKDPISRFRLVSEDFLRMGERLAGLRLPTTFIMEGGYAVEAIGVNCVNTLAGFEGA